MGRGRPGRSVRAQCAFRAEAWLSLPHLAQACFCLHVLLLCAPAYLCPAPGSGKNFPASGHCQNPLPPSPSEVKTRLQAFHPTFPSHWVIPWHLQGCVRQRASFKPERSHHRCCVLHWPVSSCACPPSNPGALLREPALSLLQP